MVIIVLYQTSILPLPINSWPLIAYNFDTKLPMQPLFVWIIPIVALWWQSHRCGGEDFEVLNRYAYSVDINQYVTQDHQSITQIISDFQLKTNKKYP